MVLELTDKNFEQVIGSGLTLVDFWAPWCGPCRAQGPVIEEFAAEHGDKIAVCKLNVDDYPAISKRFGVMSIPSLLLFNDGKLVTKVVGLQTKEQLIKLAGL